MPPIEAIAREAHVGKQTIYRWWDSRAALIFEAMAEYARVDVPAIPTGDVHADVGGFLAATFRSARRPVVAKALRALMAEAQQDAHALALLQRFTSARRDALRALLEQHAGVSVRSVDLVVDQAFGVVWYRLLVGHRTLTNDDATELARRLVDQLRT